MNNKKIGIISSNIYMPGGTTRSNINLANEFLTAGHSVTFFNVINRKKIEDSSFKAEHGWIDKAIEVEAVEKLLDTQDYDIFVITRESYFKVAQVIKQQNPQAFIVGEIHAPLAYLPSDRDALCPDYIDSYRLATQTIADKFKETYQLNNVFVFNVSLRHVFDLFEESPSPVTNHLLSYSRFDERQKKLSKAIKLAEILGPDYTLYLNGYGPDEKMYRNMIVDSKLSNVLVNEKMPEDYVYVSTADYETLGYSIAEAIAKGKKVILTKGLDGEIFNIYKAFEGIYWLSNEDDDSEKIKLFLNDPLSQLNYDVNKRLLSNEFIVSEYAVKLIKTINNLPKAPKNMVSLNRKKQLKIIMSLEDSLIKKLINKIIK
ncbi:glycosyltransferase family 4 protein [Vagococcus zengguangii]|uniref:Glycosyltransferase family 4 protein n=1 Tax=Vagococcus zengguangii TaxID=2571750 RepID=A0A4D7CUK5_9ENTE|nr:glycosyltransferase family 4 protein [Vagococcus zengguangii]QCI87043.1 glycosyltransferase family 4 protein [Vagococcus zengguangii]